MKIKIREQHSAFGEAFRDQRLLWLRLVVGLVGVMTAMGQKEGAMKRPGKSSKAFSAGGSLFSSDEFQPLSAAPSYAAGMFS